MSVNDWDLENYPKNMNPNQIFEKNTLIIVTSQSEKCKIKLTTEF